MPFSTVNPIMRDVRLLVAVLLLHASVALGHTTIVYPAPESDNDSRFTDIMALLSLALKDTIPEFGEFSLQPSRPGMNETRALSELKKGEVVDVVWSSTSIEKEAAFIPIRIPLRKGLLSYRIALIAAENQPVIDKVHNVNDLKHLSVGQGLDWGDIAIYQSNGIPVVTANYESLFAMTAHKRFYLFPRGINEVFDEYQKRKTSLPNLAIEKRLVLYYPWPYYFFVNKNNQKLAARIELGLRRMMKDGSFDRIFWQYNSAAIRKAKLHQRRIIRLFNPLLPPKTPLNEPYWLLPEEKGSP